MSAPAFPLSPDGIRTALQALGDTAERVAQALRAGGHRGVPGSCRACPVAKYLSALYPDCTVDVGVGRARVSPYDGSGSVAASLPSPVGRFVAAFDEPGTSAREYLELREHPFAEAGATS